MGGRRILLAVDFEIEARLIEGIIRDGHEIVDRVTGAESLAEAVTRWRPDAAIVQAGPETLTAESLAACDASGTRTVAITSGDLERRHALSLGLADRIDAEAGWDRIGALLASPLAHESGRLRRGEGDGEPGRGLGGDPGDVTGVAPGGHRGTGPSLPHAPTALDGAEPVPMSRRQRRRDEREGARQRAPGRAEGDARAPAASRDDAAESRRGGTGLADGTGARTERRGRKVPPGRGRPEAAAAERSSRRSAAAGASEHPLVRWSAALRRRSGEGHERPDAEPLARCTAIWGAHGSPGVTTIAIGVAAALAGRGRRVLLIDADVYGGAIAPLLGIADEAPGFAAACRLAGAGGLTAGELDRVASTGGRAETRFHVLTGIANPARWPELSGRRVREVIEVVRPLFDDIIIDAGFNLETDEELLSDVAAPRRNAATLAAIDSADRIVAVGEGTPVGVHRHLRARTQLAMLVPDPGSVITVANRIRASAVGVDAAGQVRHVLQRFGGISDPILLPEDARACDRAVGDGIPVVDAAPRSALARGVAQLAGLLDRAPSPTRAARASTTRAGAAP